MDEAIFIDANIFLEIFLDESKSNNCKELLKSLQDNYKKAVTTDFVMYSCILITQYNLKETKFVKNAIIFFNYYKNLKILRPSLDDLYYAAEIMSNNKLDFDDSLIVACMGNNDIKKIASLDKHFDKVKSIQRIKP
jgi:predicted nucleic acid-binding protein